MSWIKNLDNKLLCCSRSFKKKARKYIEDAPKRKTQRIKELKQEIEIQKLNTQLQKQKIKQRKLRGDDNYML